MRKINITLYSIHELSSAARQRALESCRLDTPFDPSDVIEEAKEMGKALGIQVDNVYTNVAPVQGAGSCFIGRYEEVTDAADRLAKIVEDPDHELLYIARELDLVMSRSSYKATANITLSRGAGSATHEYSVDIDVRYDDGATADDFVEVAVKEALQAFMRWIHDRMLAENEDQMSDGAMMDRAEANGWLFTEHGNRAIVGGE